MGPWERSPPRRSPANGPSRSPHGSAQAPWDVELELLRAELDKYGDDAKELKLGFEYRNCVRRQVEFYFSSTNLRRDKYFHDLIDSVDGGWVPLHAILKCSRMRKLRVTEPDVMLALRGSKLEVRTVTAEEAKAESESAKEAEADGSVASKETGVTGEEEGKPGPGDNPPPQEGTYVRRRDRRLPPLNPSLVTHGPNGEGAGEECETVKADGNEAWIVDDEDDEVVLDYPLLRHAEVKSTRDYRSPMLGPLDNFLMPQGAMNHLIGLVQRSCSRRRDGGARLQISPRGEGHPVMTDADVPGLCRELEAWLRAQNPTTMEVDIACNNLGDAAAAHFIGWLRRQPIPVQLFKLYKNRIGDMAVSELTEMVLAQKQVLEEVHLSHNCITAASIPPLLRAFAEHGSYPRRYDEDCFASWVRLEHNWIDVQSPALEEVVNDPHVRCVTHTDRKALRVRKTARPLTRVVVYGFHWQEPQHVMSMQRPRFTSRDTNFNADAPEFVPSGAFAPVPRGEYPGASAHPPSLVVALKNDEA